ncbi:hypothetical protein GN958_ATG05020, partial [Phytophthora infestans]
MAGRRKRSLEIASVDSSKRTRPRRGSAACGAEELREEGWTSKRSPRNALDSFYRYIRPGSDLKGEEGKDFFAEEALLNFYLRKIALSPSTQSRMSPLSALPSHRPAGRSSAACVPSLNESWIKDRIYKKVSAAYIVG